MPETATSKKWNLMLSALIIIVCGILLAACAEGVDQSGSVPSELVYVPEFIQPENMEDMFQHDMLVTKDTVCYPVSKTSDDTGEVSLVLCRYSLQDGTTEETQMDLEHVQSVLLLGWTLGNDGSFYAVANIRKKDEARENSGSIEMLLKCDSEGTQIFSRDISELFADGKDYNVKIATDDEGRIYLSTGDGIQLVDKEGNLDGTVRLSLGSTGMVNGLCCGSDGRVYVSIFGAGFGLYRVNFIGKSLSSGQVGFPEDGGALAKMADGSFLVYNNESAYRYDIKGQEKEKLFDWSDCGINGISVRAMGVLSDKRIIAAYQDWQGTDSGMALLSGVSYTEVPQKQEIVVGVTYVNPDMSAAVVEFNKSSEWHATIRKYDSDERLNADLVSANCPDVVALPISNWEQLAAKGVFEDLSPYLEQSARLSRDNMFESLLRGYTYADMLVSIPSTFYLYTYVGRSDEVGEEMGWTLDELIAILEAHPEKELFSEYSPTAVLNLCLAYCMDSFVDWDRGVCDFNCEEFKRVLEFAAHDAVWENLANELTWDEKYAKIMEGKVLLQGYDVAGVYDIQFIQAIFRGDVTAVGYITMDGSGASYISGDFSYGISAKSDAKEAAWALLETYLTMDNSRYQYGFPNDRSKFDNMIEKEKTQEYATDVNGDPLLDENGNLMPAYPRIFGGYGVNVTAHIPNQEEIDALIEMIENGRPYSGRDRQIFNIIEEEAGAFFRGQKSLDDVVDVIQRRVNNYVSENS